MSKKFVVAQIGCGGFATEQHGPNVVRNQNVSRLKWACDMSKDRADRYTKQFNAEKTTTLFEDVATDPEVDIILIATSHEAHVPIIESAAANGKHIYCEKPIFYKKFNYQNIKK